MKVCLTCSHTFTSQGWKCPDCGFQPMEVGGFPAFAPELAADSAGFDASYFERLAPLEGRNFWFRSRSRLILWAIRRYFPSARRFFEVGCGTGYVLSGVEQGGLGLEVSGSEIYTNGLKFAQERVRSGALMQMDARTIPFRDEFDIIGAFDVLEHIAEDEAVLAQMFGALRPEGGILITVPQHMFLWSAADEHAHHVRRYSAGELVDKVRGAGFTVRRVTSFVSLLLPAMIFSRLPRREGKAQDPYAELRISGIANALLETVMTAERTLIRAGVSFPAGGSLLLAAAKTA